MNGTGTKKVSWPFGDHFVFLLDFQISALCYLPTRPIVVLLPLLFAGTRESAESLAAKVA